MLTRTSVQNLLAVAFWLHPSQVQAAVRCWQPSQLVGTSTRIVSAELVTVIIRQVQAICTTTTTVSELPVTVINSVTETLGSPLTGPTVFPNVSAFFVGVFRTVLCGVDVYVGLDSTGINAQSLCIVF